MSASNIQTFFQWAKSPPYTHLIRSSELSNDHWLDLDIRAYIDYLTAFKLDLAAIKLDISIKLEEYLTEYSLKNIHSYADYITGLQHAANSIFETFTIQQREIRDRDYYFIPSSTVVPTFKEFCNVTSSHDFTANNLQKPHLYDAYITSIARVAGVATARITAEFTLSREQTAEGDRRELYGFSRQPDTEALRYLHSIRQDFRDLFVEYIESAPRRLRRGMIETQIWWAIESLRRPIAIEQQYTEEKKAEVLMELHRLQNIMKFPLQGLLQGPTLRDILRPTIQHEPTLRHEPNLPYGPTLRHGPNLQHGLTLRQFIFETTRDWEENHIRHMSQLEWLEAIRDEFVQAAADAELSDDNCDEDDSRIRTRPRRRC